MQSMEENKVHMGDYILSDRQEWGHNNITSFHSIFLSWYDSIHSSVVYQQVPLLTRSSPSPPGLPNPSPHLLLSPPLALPSMLLSLSLSLSPSLSLPLSLPPSFPLKQSNCLQHSSESPTLSDADQAPASQSLFSTATVNTSHWFKESPQPADDMGDMWMPPCVCVCLCVGVCASRM